MNNAGIRLFPLLLYPLTLLMACGTLAVAGQSALSSQRADFLTAEKALRQQDRKTYLRLKSRLPDYPLYPYLVYRELTGNPGKLTGERVEQFLENYGDTPLARRMRNVWLDQLSRQGRWDDYRTFYRPVNNTRRHCRYLQAQLNTGHAGEAMGQVEEIWLHGRSQPRACDPVFKAWREAGRLTPSLVWQRIGLAMAARQKGLASYLGRYLTAGDKDVLALWLEIHNRPRRILDAEKFSDPHPYREQILLHGVQRLARKQPEKAEAAWNTISRLYNFNDDQRYQANRAIALGSLRDPGPDLLERFDRIEPRETDKYLLETRIRAALSRQDWQMAKKWISALPQELAETERWRYWRARALEGSGDREKARAILEELAGNRSYHGFLAADRIDGPYHLEHQPLEVNLYLIGNLSIKSGVSRARELYLLNRFLDARREWRMATADLDTRDLQAAAKIAQSWGWYDQAIFTLARTGYWDDLELRFPIEHDQYVDRAVDKRQLDKSWIFAVVRQESAFAPDARSPAGALGLMQLMPGTARSVANRLKLPPPGKRRLLRPSTNINLGTAYLRQVMDRLDDNAVLATAAYNAGPHRVMKWLPDETTPADIWVETIPFSETRRYTQLVLSYAVIYDKRLGREPRRLENSMAPVQPLGTLATRTSGVKTSRAAL